MIETIEREIEILASCSRNLQGDYQEDDRTWDDSPFAWIKRTSSSRKKGTIAEKLISNYLATRGFEVTRAPDAEADRLVDGCRAEIKMSTLWDNGLYKFQQIRDQNYYIVICLGISPFDAHCWVLPKDTVMEQWEIGGIKPQHGGKAGSDTAWLSVDPTRVEPWLRPHGGWLAVAVRRLAEITGRALR